MFRRGVRVLNDIQRRKYTVRPDPVKSTHGSKASIIMTLLVGSAIAGIGYIQMLPVEDQGMIQHDEPQTESIIDAEQETDESLSSLMTEFVPEVTSQLCRVEVTEDAIELDTQPVQTPTEVLPNGNSSYFSRRTKITASVLGVIVPVMVGTGYYLSRMANRVADSS